MSGYTYPNFHTINTGFVFFNLKSKQEMSVSMEAMAMAGMDYTEWGIDIDEFELEDYLDPPAHLLAHEEEDDDETMKKPYTHNCSFDISKYNANEKEDSDLHKKLGGQRDRRIPKCVLFVETIIRLLIIIFYKLYG